MRYKGENYTCEVMPGEFDGEWNVVIVRDSDNKTVVDGTFSNSLLSEPGYFGCRHILKMKLREQKNKQGNSLPKIY